MMLGTVGVVYVSVLTVVAYFVPYLYRASIGLLERRRVQRENRSLAQESPQEG